MVRKLIIGVVLTVALSVAAAESVQAQDVDYARPAWYVSVAGTFNVHLFEEEVDSAIPGVIDLEHAWGFDIKAGKRLYKWLSLELEFEYIDGFDFNLSDTKILTLRPSTLTGNVKFHYPFGRFLPYGIVGIGGTWFDIKDQFGIGIGFDTDVALAGRFGAGFDIFLTEHWAINANYSFVLTTFDLTNPAVIENISSIHYGSTQLGVAYYF